MKLHGASTYFGADPAPEINMDRMNSPYLTGLSSESSIDSLVAIQKTAPFEVQGIKLMKRFISPGAQCFQTNNWAADG